MRRSCLPALFLLLWVPSVASALSVGEQLKPLNIAAEPAVFDYQLTGEGQIILIYPLNFSSYKMGQFARRIIAAGYCPKAIIDMSNRAHNQARHWLWARLISSAGFLGAV